ncbi:MAG: transposase [Desulfitobacteriaceae bacterium]
MHREVHVRFGGEYTKTCHYWVRRCVLSLRKPVFNILETYCVVVIANPKYVKGIRGKKTDKKDSIWLCDLHKHGLVPGSFIPPLLIRQIRDLMRYRFKLINVKSSEKNRIQNSLTVSSKKCTYFKVHYDQIKKRRGHKKAIIAIAHKLLNCIYHMLDNNETFNYDLYKIDSKPKQTYASQITVEMAIRYLQTLGYQIPDMRNTT